MTTESKTIMTHLAASHDLKTWLQIEGIPFDRIDTTHESYFRLHVELGRDEIFRMGEAFADWKRNNPHLLK